MGRSHCFIKKRYKSLRQAWQHTSVHWNEFHRATRLEESKPTIRKTSVHKLNSDEQNSINEFFLSDEVTFPMPDKKYAGRKRFMKSSLSTSLRMYNLLPSTTRRICLSTLRKYKPQKY